MAARIGVVGIGWWACFNHIPTLQASDNVEAVAICDLSDARLAEVGDRFGITARYKDVGQMVAEQVQYSASNVELTRDPQIKQVIAGQIST